MAVLSFGDNSGNTTGTDDAKIRQQNAATNYASTTDLEITEWAAGDFTYVVIKFTGYPTGITAGSTITSARMRLYLTSANAGSHDISFYNLLVAFTESQVTWNIRQTATNWTSAGAQGSGTDRSASAVCTATGIGTTTGQYYDFTFSAAGLTWLQGVLDGGTSNHGMSCDRTAGADSQFRVFASSEGTDGQRPILEVTYTEAGGGGGQPIVKRFGGIPSGGVRIGSHVW